MRSLLAATLVVFVAGVASAASATNRWAFDHEHSARASHLSTSVGARYDSTLAGRSRNRTIRPDEVAMAPPPDEFDAPAEPTVTPDVPAAADPEPVENNSVWAVIVGINDYPGTHADLESAVADANDMDDALASFAVPASHRYVLRDREASAANIADAADWLVANSTPSTTAVFFYAGHVRKLAPTTEAIVGADGRLLTDSDLAAHLQPLAAKDAWIVMASCFGGGFTEVVQPGRVLTAAADANSVAYENETFGRSYLDEYLIRDALLDHESGPTVQEAFAFAQTALARDYPDRMLTEIDETDHAVSLDGQDHALVPPPSIPPPAASAPPPPGGPPTTPAPTTPPATSPPTTACDRALLVWCKRGG